MAADGDSAAGPGTPSYLRLAGALVAAPLVLAAILTGAVFLIGAAADPDRAAAEARTASAARTFFLYLPLFSLSVGLAGSLALVQLGWRSAIAWGGTGAALGAASAIALGAVGPAGIVVTHVIVITLAGLFLFLLIRRLAGVRPYRSGDG